MKNSTSTNQATNENPSVWVDLSDLHQTPVPVEKSGVIEEVLIWYDGPLLSLARLPNGQYELISWVDTEDESNDEDGPRINVHLCCTVSDELAKRILAKDDSISFADVYLAPGAQFTLEIEGWTHRYQEGYYSICRLRVGDFSNVPCEYLPTKLRLKLSW